MGLCWSWPAYREKGRWGQHPGKCFILVALDRYFRTYEKATPDFIAKVWLGDGFAGQHRFKGARLTGKTSKYPCLFCLPSGIQPITLQKTGPGRLYYRLGLKYAPQNLKLKPSDHGFTVTRRYEAVDDPSDVTRNRTVLGDCFRCSSPCSLLTMVAQPVVIMLSWWTRFPLD